MSGRGGSIFLGLVAWLIFIMTPCIIGTTQVGMKLTCVSLKFALKNCSYPKVTYCYPNVNYSESTLCPSLSLSFTLIVHYSTEKP